MRALRRAYTHLTEISHPDEDTRRRGRTFVTLIMLLLLILLPLAPAPLLIDGSLLATLVVLGLLVVSLGLIALTRRGFVDLAAFSLIALIILTLCLTALTSGRPNVEAFFFTIAIMLAGVTLRPGGVVLVALICFGCIAALTSALGADSSSGMPDTAAVFYGSILCLFAAVYSAVGSYTNRRSLRLVERARAEAEGANAALEQRVLERTAELQQALDAQARQASVLQDALDEQRRLATQLVELSIPVIPVRADTLVVPLVGVLDGPRAEELQTRVLEQIQRHGTRVLILDITGVPVVDAQIAGALVRAAEAARLLGARPVLVGVRPEVSQSLVALGADLRALTTTATLQQALEWDGVTP
jgi:rsbT co-antagonist protein RsbR